MHAFEEVPAIDIETLKKSQNEDGPWEEPRQTDFQSLRDWLTKLELIRR